MFKFNHKTINSTLATYKFPKKGMGSPNPI